MDTESQHQATSSVAAGQNRHWAALRYLAIGAICLGIGYAVSEGTDTPVFEVVAELAPLKKPAPAGFVAAVHEAATPAPLASAASLPPVPVAAPVAAASAAPAPEAPPAPEVASEAASADVDDADDAPEREVADVDVVDGYDDLDGAPQEFDFVATLTVQGAAMPEGLAELEPGTLSQLSWYAGQSLYGSAVPTPVLVAEGKKPGQSLCLTAAVHGDEINGIEIVRRVMYSVNPEKLKGRVIGVPIVNMQAFERSSRYLPDRRDLNRFFPGNARGSSASRIASSLFEDVIAHCDALVDLHTGSFHRTNLPQLRANLEEPDVVALAESFGSMVILHSKGGKGTLRSAATLAGIPAVTLEAGEPLRIDDKAVKQSTKAILALMSKLRMYKRSSLFGNPQPAYYSSRWVRADQGGVLIGEAKLGKRVRKGDVLGVVVDPITNARQKLTAPANGRVIGMALDQFVMPGYAAFHLGIEAQSLEELESSPGDDGVRVDQVVAQSGGFERERDDSE